nr:uncharacterized protein LOC129280031 [Lytechinus pictus]
MLNRQEYLLVTDYYSKYPIIAKLTDTSSAAITREMTGIFSLFGPPEEIVSDNGPQFVGKPFQDMCKKWNIKHITSSPHYPRSNGLAERIVRQPVRVLHPRDHTWIPAKVSKVCEEPRSYEVSTPNGGILRRNRSHLREVPSTNPTPKRVKFDDDHTTETQPEEDNVQRTPMSNSNANQSQQTYSQTTRSGRTIRKPERFMFED